METIDLIERNRQRRPDDPGDVPTSPGAPGVIVTCIDARVDPAHIVGLLPGEASVFRTVGGRVTDAVIEQLGMVAGLAKLLAGDEAELDVALIHHTSCGASLFGDHGVQQRLAATAGTSPEKVATLAIADPVDTVRGDLDRLRDSVLPARLRVSGYVYDVATGVLEPVEDTRVLRSTA